MLLRSSPRSSNANTWWLALRFDSRMVVFPHPVSIDQLTVVGAKRSIAWSTELSTVPDRWSGSERSYSPMLRLRPGADIVLRSREYHDVLQSSAGAPAPVPE